MDKDYKYYNDGSLKFVDDNLATKFDRLNVYDFVGRIKQAKTGTEASGGSGGEIPYRQTYTYNAFGDMTARENIFWGVTKDASYTFSNGRVTNAYWDHDADGRVVQTSSPDIPSLIKYDAAGRLEFKHDYPASTEIGDKVTRFYDGDGRELKRYVDRCQILYPEPPQNPPEECEFTGDILASGLFIRSTVLGGEVISEARLTGDKKRSYVIAGGVRIAELSHRYTFGPTTQHNAAHFYHIDPSGMSQRVTRNSPENLLGTDSSYPNYIDPRQQEYDPTGNNAGTVANFIPAAIPPSEPLGIENDTNFINGQVVNATQNGLSIPMSVARNLINTANIGGINGLTELSLLYMSHYRWTGSTNGDGISSFGFSVPDFNSILARRQLNGRGAKPPTPDYTKLQQAVNGCAKEMYGVELTGGSWSGAGSNGQMEFRVQSGTTVNVYGLIATPAQTFTVYNDVRSYTSRELGGWGRGFSMVNGATPGIYRLTMRWTGNDGQTRRANIWTNRTFTASDRASGNSIGQRTFGFGLGISGFIHTQIHETGNALSILTGRDPEPAGDWTDASGVKHQIGISDPSGSGDGDNGMSFEACVFVFYRNLMGLS